MRIEHAPNEVTIRLSNAEYWQLMDVLIVAKINAKSCAHRMEDLHGCDSRLAKACQGDHLAAEHMWNTISSEANNHPSKP